jgi:hypothetical protein
MGQLTQTAALTKQSRFKMKAGHTGELATGGQTTNSYKARPSPQAGAVDRAKEATASTRLEVAPRLSAMVRRSLQRSRT